MLPYRDRNPSGDTPWVTWSLIAVNTLVFLAYWPLGTDESVESVYRSFGMVPYYLSHFHNPGSIVSAMFIHGGWLHLFINMLFLRIFGDNMEAELGRVAFLSLYLAAGMVANIVQFIASPLSMLPVGGASGAVAGVMGGYFLMFPRARVLVLAYLVIAFRVFAVPAWVLLSLWFLLQLLGGISTGYGTTTVAFWAHIGGFLAGVALTAKQWRLRGGTRFWHRFHGLPPHPEADSRVPVVRRAGTTLPPPKRRGLFGKSD